MTDLQRCCERYGLDNHEGSTATGVLSCGCLHNEIGAHKGACPDFETVYPENGSRDLDDLSWRPRTEVAR
ncbi:hypothetical protein [Paractinoplanes maris]|uniref:hypothetical protein n=1 Tax=Paractinoplanes maris TaxID=1734446 RepID=UPI0020207F1F|nr:hypothetical protein [Actinoplanes maris]